MTYSRRNVVDEQKEARQKAENIIAICEQLHIKLDPIDWQNSGMRASVKVNDIEISDLTDLGQQDSTSILRKIQLKLFEQAALKSVNARPGLSALMWSPVDVMQPQAFSSLWIITLENDERIAIAEYIRDGERVYEPYTLDTSVKHYLTKLFGPIHTGEYLLGASVTVEERDRKFTGEIIYILPPSKASANRKSPSRGRHMLQGKLYTNDAASRYVVDCGDGFPHVVNQWQIVSEPVVEPVVEI